ncbi:NRAMP (natural resistance-associated macrophage protein) metal ion transporter family protein (macronuclear) [Tetrahymena thermophila SB210]|uniref:NRAMP (Natural resistance-associated macrophage protein) metal ion transporter family protein n=1 Tax=Tetrahymena thermophila (strain SB210) TaxID=312017 RepID=I7MMV8_TETTS|nr:NRAMP (natural resistance-associated macrophage protein) metal ion transporter family protein [Tetrahymena thermophila SB210]EAS07058.3 NRAMP (natural resistance-associated macrophage protein) metal ion transporter family protein [Tetrahymena thermophila SB210]|eukprot:XP_001027300.3 NRAMP (natural resistance-associated macrophage protein) metal ion transporter family protein [Tetrahymena thermophila SB210]
MEILQMQNSSEQDLAEQSNFKFSWKDLFQYFGPGLLISIAYLDPGNLAGDMEAGLVGKYSLLWVLFLSTALGYLFQVKSMKLGLVTGKDLAKLCRIHLNSKERTLLWIMAEIAIMGSDIQEVLGTAIGLKILFGLELWIGVLLTIFTTFLILLVKICGMRSLEAVFALLIGTMAICFFINLGYIQPNPLDILKGMVVPTIPSGAYLASIGLLGAVIMPHNIYLHSALMNEKNIDKNDKKLVSKSIFYFKIETALSLLLSFLISGSVICTFAYYSNQNQVESGDIKLSNAGDVLAGSFGQFAKYIWGIGLLASGQSSTLTGTLAGQYVMSGFIKMKMGDFSRALLTRSIAIIPSVVIAFVNENEDFNIYLNLLQAIQLPFAIIPLLKFSSNQYIMGQDAIQQNELIFLSVASSLIVISNYYCLMPQKIDFSSKLTYFMIFICLLYFVFLIYVLVSKIAVKPKKYSDEISINRKSPQNIDIEDIENNHINSQDQNSEISQRNQVLGDKEQK